MTKYIGPKTADENVATQADKLSLSSATPDALTPDQAGAAGTATTAARSDHQHEILAGAAGTILPDDAAAEGASSSFARADHTHAITAAAPSANLTASTTNSEGTASSFARSDHSHAITTGAPGTITPDAVAATGTSASLARADHTHAIAAAAAGTITGTNSEGTSTSFARADHDHAIGVGWTSYTPQLQASTTNPTTGTGGTRAGRYIQVGKMVTYQFFFQFGTSGMNAGAGIYRLVLPVTATRTTLGGNFTAGTVRLYDNDLNKNISLNFFVHDADTYIRMAWHAHNDGANDVSATSPWTWAASDIITGTIIYEAA